ncbi:D-2-hydroxyacid dehydrogenase [Planococcus lenghuensis]|uniref:D-2-hydroxyacid dehydrogenase n=1 Tax=Planococcus lenghuensis TaxID=2213202 RepID=A0A1Q2KXG4_9BACL|nr:D-2-hydroxyacid dehydrogenase [Planococcus lenghuensis]AQQ52507.1 D-2-hydroxyacid dehydrogenase [Planococcus lenghuensis]
MTKERSTIVLFTFVPKEQQQRRLLDEFPDVTFLFTYHDKSRLEEAEIIVTYGEDLAEKDIDRAKKLKWIMVASAGIEKMPASTIQKKGITVSNVRGIHKTPMSESVLAHLLALKRSLPFIYEQQRKGEWNRKSGATELAGSTALILGPGAIGSEIGRLLQAFGVRTIGCNRSGNNANFMEKTVPYPELMAVLPEADVVISVLPSTPETRHLLTEAHFYAMKDNAVFMNFGRGDLVSDQVLIHALEEKLISWAVLDVFETEPLPKDHPFWTMDNVIVSPHVSSHSTKYVERSLDIFIPNLKKWLKGKRDFTNIVNLERGY